MYHEMLTRLATTSATIAALDVERAELVADVDDTITTLREAGCSWPLINQACGTKNVQVSWERRRRPV